MYLKRIIYIFFLCFSLPGFAQVNEKDILMTIDDEPILASEFIRVYSKNLDLVQDESQKDVDAYLELFVNYKLKIKEAKRLGVPRQSIIKVWIADRLENAS